MAMKLEHDDLNRLIDKISKSDFQEFSLEGEDFKLDIKRNLTTPQASQVFAVPQENIDQSQAQANNEALGSLQLQAPPPTPPPGRSDLTEITSPMVGTFYRASAPGEDPFVEIGTPISVGQTICILEAMKLMNEIESEHNAEVVEILVENGTPVEFGQVLMRVKQS